MDGPSAKDLAARLALVLLWLRLGRRLTAEKVSWSQRVLALCGLSASSLAAAVVALGTCGIHGEGPLRWAVCAGAKRYSVDGFVAAGFEPVREAFRLNFELGTEKAAQFCLYHRGVKVVDIFGSLEEVAGYDGDSLQLVMSSTKVLESLAVAIAVDRGLLDYNAPITRYWPEFAADPLSDKARKTVGDLMRHQAGLPKFDKRVSRYDFEHMFDQEAPIARKIERSPAIFPGPSNRCYHGTTRGLITNELLRRIDPEGRSFGRMLQEAIAGPLGVAKSCHCGTLPVEEGKRKEKSDLVPLPTMLAQLACVSACTKLGLGPSSAATPFRFGACVASRVQGVLNKDSGVVTMMLACEKEVGDYPNADWWSSVESPSSNGHCSARALARIAACLAGGGELDGTRIISPEGLKKALGDPEEAWDDGVNFVTVNGNAGWTDMSQPAFAAQAVEAGMPQGCEPFRGFFGWGGYGGSCMAFNLEEQVGVSYCMTGHGNVLWCGSAMSDPRGLSVMRAARECLRSASGPPSRL